jgi:uncharacterized cupin superfamily protein
METTIPASTSLGDVLAAELEVIGPRAGATRGEPVESGRTLTSDGVVETGVWEVTPGTFPGAKDSICELMHFVAGRGTITSADGTVTTIGPGVVMFTPDGWRGTWDVEETVRKTYVIVRTR